MKDDPELQSEDSGYPHKRRPIGSGNNRSLLALLIILLVFIFAGGIIYFLSKRPAGSEPSPLESKVTGLEERIAGLERQITEVQGKISTSGSESAILQRVDALARKIETLEKQKQPTAGSEAKPSASSKPTASAEKHYHVVQKGDTLHRISKKYGMTTEELRKLNNLPVGQPLRTGQKLLVSPRR